jgi:hypothetical protein
MGQPNGRAAERGHVSRACCPNLISPKIARLAKNSILQVKQPERNSPNGVKQPERTAERGQVLTLNVYPHFPSIRINLKAQPNGHSPTGSGFGVWGKSERIQKNHQ